MMEIKKIELTHRSFKTNALLFFKESSEAIHQVAIFTHGYTAHKGQLITWGHKLAAANIPTLIFDLPGHYLGSFNEIESFDEFKNHVHELFSIARAHLPTTKKIILGGHSMGAFLSLKALTLSEFDKLETLNICVGLGLPDEKKTHAFNTPFYDETMRLYSQLVSPHLSVKNVLHWIYESRKEVTIHNKKIHLLTGENDFIVGDGAERLKDILEAAGNDVSITVLKHLPHNSPEIAGTAIRTIALS